MELLFRLFFLFICSAFCDMHASSFSFQKLDLPYEDQGNYYNAKTIDNENRIYGYVTDKDKKVTSIFSYSSTGELSVTPLPSDIVLNEPVCMNRLGQIAGIYRRTTTVWPAKKKREFQSLFLFDISGQFTDMGILSDRFDEELPKPEFSILSLNEKEQILIQDRQGRFAVGSNGTFIDIDLDTVYRLNNQNKIPGLKNMEPLGDKTLVLYDIETAEITEIDTEIEPATLISHIDDRNRVLYQKNLFYRKSFEEIDDFIDRKKNNLQKFVFRSYLWTPETRKIEKIKKLFPILMSPRGHILATEKNRDLKKLQSNYLFGLFSVLYKKKNFKIDKLLFNIESLILIENNGNQIDLSETLQNARESGWSFLSSLEGIDLNFVMRDMSDRDSIVGIGLFEDKLAYFLIIRNEAD